MKKLLFMAILAPAISNALEIKFTPNSTCSALTACQDALADAQTEANKELPPISEDDYATGISNSVGIALKGSGSDYGDNFGVFVVKASAGAGIQSEDPSFEDKESIEGIGIGGALTVGLNMGLLPVEKIGSFEFKRLDVFLSGMSYGLDQENDDFNFEGDISTFGVFARYRLYDPVDILPGYMLQWGGLHLHTGLQRSTMNIELSQSIEGTEETNDGYTIDYDANAIFDIESTVTSIPVEFSTYLRAAYVFTLFGGAGFDINMGKSDVTLRANGNLSESSLINGDVGTVSANGDGSGSPEATNFRAFGGIQVNIPFMRVYAQVNKNLSTDVIGANAGIKILW